MTGVVYSKFSSKATETRMEFVFPTTEMAIDMIAIFLTLGLARSVID